LEVFPLSLKQYTSTSNTLFNTPPRDLIVALPGICVGVYDVFRMSRDMVQKLFKHEVKTKHIERIEHPTMVFFLLAVFTP
jgi:hypothetical protein